MATPATLVTGVEFGDAALSAQLSQSMARIENLIEGEISRGDAIIRESVLHLFRAGGKRLRPLFTALSAQFGPEPTGRKVIVGGAIIELVHLATLYHDDVMDHAQIRRSVPSANALWGNNGAILAGDYLLATASRMIAAEHLGDDAGQLLADTCGQLVTGQVRETRGAANNADRVEHYMQVVSEKTGSLLAAAGWFGATFSGAEQDVAERLSRFGQMIGTAFQISDDIIDIDSDAEQSGKMPGTDLKEGIHTLPVLYSLTDSGHNADKLRHLLSKPIVRDDDLAEALCLLRTSQGMLDAKKVVAKYAALAQEELAGLPDVPGRQALAALADFTMNRHG